MRTWGIWLIAVMAGLSAGCGGGGGGSASSGGNPPPPQPPSGLSYPAPPPFIVGTAIAQLTPTVTGSPTGYSISPALPAGLVFSTTSGSISGTPTAPQATTAFTVTATNAGGSTTTSLSITVNDAAPSISYPRSSYTFAAGVPLAGVTPSSNGGAVASWSITPALPAGLAFNADTGAISGTASAPGAATAHVITATNGSGSDSFNLSIGISDPVAFDLGHATRILNLDYAGNRVLSVDQQRHVVLWNAQTGSRVLERDPDCDVTCQHGDLVGSLAGSTVAIRSRNGFALYDAGNGASIANIDAPAAQVPRWKLATDGSYLVLYGSSQLAVWSSAGSSLFTLAGNYDNANIIALPGVIRVASTSGLVTSLVSITVPGGVSTVNSFSSTPPMSTAWFEDGNRLIGAWTDYRSVISPQGAALATGTSPWLPDKVGGFGDWYWSSALDTNVIEFYFVGGGSAPVATYALDPGRKDVFHSGSTVIFVSPGNSGRSVSMVDLSGPALVKNDYTLPVFALTGFASLSSAEWVFGTADGVVMGELNAGTPQLYSHGRVQNLGASQSRVSANTASGRILNFSTATRTLESEIDFHSYQVRLTADGSVLAAGSSTRSSALRLYSMPSRTVIAEWPRSVAPNDSVFSFDMSDDGRVILQSMRQTTGGVTTYGHRLLRLDTTPAGEEPLVNIVEPVARLSPSGAMIAASSLAGPHLSPGVPSTTRLFANGALVASADGWAVDWLDDTRLFMNRYLVNPGTTVYQHARIVGTNGNDLASPAMPSEIFDLQSLGNDLIYAGQFHNQIYHATTGASVWSSPATDTNFGIQGAVAGDTVFFTAGTTIRAEPR